MKKNLLILVLSLLITPFFVSASVISYERNPTGLEITSPVNFSVEISATPLDRNYWWIWVNDSDWLDYCSDEYMASTTLSNTFEMVLPQKDYLVVSVQASDVLADKDDCSGTDLTLEWDDDNVIFTIVEAGPEYTPLIDFPENAVSSVAGLITDTLDAVGPFIWLFIGVPLGFVVIRRIIKIVPK